MTHLQQVQLVQTLLHQLLHPPFLLHILVLPERIPRPSLGVLAKVVVGKLGGLPEELLVLLFSPPPQSIISIYPLLAQSNFFFLGQAYQRKHLLRLFRARGSHFSFFPLGVSVVFGRTQVFAFY